ncbi:hypothetical protein MNBD_IGNAVI01-2834 [hydrothermal vent metagenome]|uniref:Secretion system C-terminal sorting domain-containing protein n=1 Tax=hydrothermal vent metagenome TaxID=652676 RepID=A0A3B1BBS5_9ZZZZ
MGNYKMNNIKFLTLLFLLLTTDIFGQGENYVIFQTSNSNIPSNNITAITQDVLGTYWICFSQDVYGNIGGVAKYDGINWEIIDIEIIEFGTTLFTDIEVDSLNNIYISTFGKGILKFDGEYWNVIDTSNSDIASNDILCISIENNDKIWFGSYWKGLIKYEFGNWTNYTQQNSGLPLDEVNQIVIDKQGDKIIGTDGAGAVRYNDSSWTEVFCNDFLGLVAIFGLGVDSDNHIWATTSGNNNHIGYVANSNCESFSSLDIGFDFLPSYPVGLGVDSYNTKWIGSTNGLVRYDENNWSSFNRDNSPIPGNWINNVFIDNNENVWFAFADTIPNSNGLAIYNENGIVGITDVDEQKNNILVKYGLSQNYPNPFNPTTTIAYQIPNDGFVNLVVYNTLGQVVSTLVNEYQTSSKYSVQFDASNLPSGVYFYRLESGSFIKVNKMLLLR